MADLFFLRLDDCAAVCDCPSAKAFARDLRALSDHDRRELAEEMQPRKVRVLDGRRYRVRMPMSECAIHMGIADTVREVRAVKNGVHLIHENGHSWGPHMTDGEAGIMWDGEDRYTYAYHGE